MTRRDGLTTIALGDGQPNAWVQRQIDEARSLVDLVVDRWEGVEMAIRDIDGDPPVISFTDSQVPCTQMYVLDLVLVGKSRVRVRSYQHDDEWGLAVNPESAPLDWSSDGFRYRVLDEVPVGEIRRVLMAISDRGDLAEIELDVDGRWRARGS